MGTANSKISEQQILHGCSKTFGTKKAGVPRKDISASSIRFSYLFQSIQSEH